MTPSNVVPLRGVRPVAKSATPEPEHPITSTTQVFNRKANLRQYTEPIRSPLARPIFLHIARGPLPESLIPLHEGDIVIGRSRTSGLRLAHNSISRKHAVITRRGDRVWLTDCGSQNGTFLNGQRVGGTSVLEYGDEIQLGNSKLILRGESIVAGGDEERPSPFQSPLIRGLTVCMALMVGMLLVVLVRSLSPGETKASAVPPPPQATRTAAAPSQVVAGDSATAKAEPTAPAKKPSASVDSVFSSEPSVSAPPPRSVVRETAAIELRAPRRHRSGASDRQALKAYLKGDIDRAVGLARKADSPLASRMEEFRLTYADAKSALSTQDYDGALDNLQRASRLDAWLAKGGRFRHDIRKKLSQVHTILGLRAVEDGDKSKAQASFNKALAFDSRNERASRMLRQLQGPQDDAAEVEVPETRRHPAGSAPAVGRRPAADQAFGQDRRSLADQAFDD